MRIDTKKFNLYQARECLSNNDFLKKADISIGVLKKIKSGTTAINMRPKTVGLIAKALNVEVQDIIIQE